MRKKVFLLFILIFLITISSIYLNYLIDNKFSYEYKSRIKPFIVNTNDINIDSKDMFLFDHFFIIKSIDNYNYQYELNDNLLFVTIYNKNYRKTFEYEYHIKEPEVIEVIKEVYKEIYINNEENINNVTDSKEVPINEQSIFSGYHDLYFPVNTDISDIIVGLTKDIKTNRQVAVDYSNLNPNIEGEYDVFYLFDDKTINIKVYIQ